MMRSVSVCVTIAGALIAARPAHADTGMLPNGAVIQWQRQYITQNGTLTEPETPDDLRQYLNLAHCLCSQAMTGDETSIAYELTLSTSTGTNRPGEYWVGTMCDGDVTTRTTNCRKLTQSIADIDALATSSPRYEFQLFDIMAGKDTSAGCPIREGDATLWLLVDSDGDTNPDYFSTKSLGNGTDVKVIDTQAPELPTEIDASSAEGAISMTWTPPTSRPDDVKYYQALCVGPDGQPVKKAADRPEQRYQTAKTLCGVDQQISLTDTTNTPGDTDGPADTTVLATLDPTYLCGETTAATATGMTIEGLQNDVPYSVVLLSIDWYGNVTGTRFLNTVTPKPATDFWEDLHDRGSKVEGGFCAASSGGSSGSTSFALVLVAGLVLVRRRRLRTAAPLAVLALVLLPRSAHAQGADAPMWEDDPAGAETAAAADDYDLVKWHIGIKVGPYIPEIDQQANMDPGPYEAMYGGYRVLPMLDVERIFWRGFGQLGAGGTIGYMQKSGHSFQEGTMISDPKRPRSEGDTNTFRLIPFAATVTYRFTFLDDEYGIPVVPYLRGGLAYYTWWVRTNGKTASVCTDGTSNPTCGKNKAYGGSLGVQGAIGLSIRAERIDANAAASMRQGGIVHAGFYGELSLAKVDGFGSETKLSVGDRTWFAGVDFEF